MKFLMKFVQVHNKVLSSGRSEVSFRVDGKVWVVAFVGKERQDSSSSTRDIVIGKLCKGKEPGPIVLLIVAIDTEVLF